MALAFHRATPQAPMTTTLPQTEKQFQQAVVDLARYQNWSVYHTFDSRRSDPGFPDLVLVKPPTIIFAELKTEGGKVSRAQDQWLARLARCAGYNPGPPEMRVIAGVWRPQDWVEIEEVLSL